MAPYSYNFTLSLHPRTLLSVRMTWLEQRSTLLGGEGNNCDLNQEISKHMSQANLIWSLRKHTIPFTAWRVLHLQLLVKVL